MRVLRNDDAVLGSLLVVLGLAAAWFAKAYPQGTLRDMGPGFLPYHLGLGIAAMGVLIGGLSLLRPASTEGGERVPLVAAAAAPLAVLLFGLVIDRLGLPVAIFAATSAMGLVWPGARRRQAVLVAAVLAVAMTILFPWLLKVPLPVLPA